MYVAHIDDCAGYLLSEQFVSFESPVIHGLTLRLNGSDTVYQADDERSAVLYLSGSESTWVTFDVSMPVSAVNWKVVCIPL